MERGTYHPNDPDVSTTRLVRIYNVTVSKTKLIATLAAAAGLLTASAALAKAPSGLSHSSPKQFVVKSNAGLHLNSKPIVATSIYKKSNDGGFKITFGGNPPVKKDWCKPCYDGHCYDHCYSGRCYNPCYYDRCYYRCYYPCYPSYSCVHVCCDTAVYGSSALFVAPAHSANAAKPVVEQPRMQIAVGGTLLVDGQVFGEKPGLGRLQVNGFTLPVEVLGWSPSAVKIRLPQLKLTGATMADIEVLRADGSLASKTAIELTTAVEHVALSN